MISIRRSLILALAVTAALLPTLGTHAASTRHSMPASRLRVAMLFSEPVAGSSWDSTAFQGLQAVHRKFGLKIAYTESVKLADIAHVAQSYARNGYGLIFGNGFEYGQPFATVAPKFPKVKFVAMTGITHGPNLMSPQIAENQGGYLSGALAGLMTKSNKVGCVASETLPFIVSQMEAYKLGAKYTNKKVTARVTYTGSFTDVAKARQAASAMADTGVDVMCADADNGGPAIIAVAKARHIWSIGMSEDQNSLAPKTVITSVIVNSPAIIKLVTQRTLQGKFHGGMPYFGVKEGAVYLASYHGLVPAKFKARMKTITDAVRTGKIKVPLITKPRS